MVRAIAMVAVSFFRPLSASFSMGSCVDFCCISVSKPPPWIMKLSITRWKIVPLKKPSRAYIRKFSTVLGARSASSSSLISPNVVRMMTMLSSLCQL